MEGLDILVDKIGKKAAQRFLTLSQPQIKKDHRELLHYLISKDQKKATTKAHYLKAMANLYATKKLLAYYKIITSENNQCQYTPSFIDNLRKELDDVEANIQFFLTVADNESHRVF